VEDRGLRVRQIAVGRKLVTVPSLSRKEIWHPKQGGGGGNFYFERNPRRSAKERMVGSRNDGKEPILGKLIESKDIF